MYDIVGRRLLWYIISLIFIVPGLVFMGYSLATHGTILPLSIDYTGGTLWEMRFEQEVDPTVVREVFVDAGYSDTQAFSVNDAQTVQAKLKDLSPEEKEAMNAALNTQIGAFEERSYRSIGPAIGNEVSTAAIGAVLIASAGILLYIAWAFRQVPHSFRYGTCAVIALVHDVLVTVTFIGVMNLVAGWEIDALFLTAILTVIGFSVNDTIVIFDRMRENIKKYRGEDLATVTNLSLWETMSRSLGTQITVFLVVSAILLFGGASLQQFMATMLVGMVSGTYSSIFSAAPILVAWEEGSLLGNRRKPQPVANEHTVPV
ncbi:MAG: protein translocase subunit SecF [Caldilineaceae bacterium]|nr:protein translocase subunit SecF [Caldilineaceae bacterium]